MIKKHLNLPILLQNGRQLSAHTRMWNALEAQPPEKTPLPEKIDGSITGKKTKYRRHTLFSVVGLFLLPVFALPAHAASAVKTGQRVLMIEMTPALCSLQPSRARMRQCLEGYSLTVSGLDLGYGERCGRGSETRLTPLQLKVVNRIMPDITVRTQVWQYYGACSPLSASSYFRQIVNLAGELKLPSELNTGNSYTVSKSRFIAQMTRLNSGMTSSSIDLICQAGTRRQTILTDVHVCYEGGEFGSCNNVVDNCGSNFIISGGK
jgi:ribonuclease T2